MKFGNFEKGDRIRWTYDHKLSYTVSTPVTRYGTYIRKIVPKKKYLAHYNPSTHSVVKFKVNRGNSRVRTEELVLISEDEYIKNTTTKHIK